VTKMTRKRTTKRVKAEVSKTSQQEKTAAKGSSEVPEANGAVGGGGGKRRGAKKVGKRTVVQEEGKTSCRREKAHPENVPLTGDGK